MYLEFIRLLKKLNYVNTRLDFWLKSPQVDYTKLDLEIISICYNLSSYISDKCREILQRVNSTKES